MHPSRLLLDACSIRPGSLITTTTPAVLAPAQSSPTSRALGANSRHRSQERIRSYRAAPGSETWRGGRRHGNTVTAFARHVGRVAAKLSGGVDDAAAGAIRNVGDWGTAGLGHSDGDGQDGEESGLELHVEGSVWMGSWGLLVVLLFVGWTVLDLVLSFCNGHEWAMQELYTSPFPILQPNNSFPQGWAIRIRYRGQHRPPSQLM